MSVIAFTTTPQQIVLLSDGRKSSEATREVIDMKSRKAYKVNTHIGLFWLGYFPYPDCDDDLMNVLDDCKTPADVAQRVGEFMKLIFTDQYRQKLKGPNRLRYCIIVVGYEGSRPVVYQLDSENEDMFNPKQVPCQTGQSGLMGVDDVVSAQAGRYEQLAGKYYQRMGNIEKACRQAFTEVVRDMEAQGRKVGGDIFCEVIQPKGKSVFQQALRN